MPIRNLTFLGVCVALLAASPGLAQQKSIVVASTTSLQDSGLFSHILPLFKAKTGIDVRVVAQGTGQALDTGRRGDANVVFVHDKAEEEKFIAAGFGMKRFPVMYNDFVLIGPATDPAGIKRTHDIAQALRAIKATAAPFISRGDRSGTHSAELTLWQTAGIDIAKDKGPWYKEIGEGMGDALNTASAENAYVLADRGTWTSFKNRGALAIIVEGDRRLFNQYGVMLVNPAKHPHVKKDLGQAFIDWLISAEGQKAIGDYKVEGEYLFFPNRTVLVIHETDPATGVPTTFSTTLRVALSTATPRVAVYDESLDITRFAGSEHEATLRHYFKEKYRDVQFSAIAVAGVSAFELVKRLRSDLWPGVPVVFGAIDELRAAELQLDSDMTGLIMYRTIKSMMVAARVLVPDLKGVALLGGSPKHDPYRRQYLRELPQLATEIEITNLTGLPLAEQVVRAATLPRDTAILYISLFIDDSGARYSSWDALAAIARSANRPIVTDVESHVGLGATGGFALNNVAYARQVASLVLRILDGASAATIPVAVSEFTQPVFDWRQLNRWQISESALPKGSEIRFRPPTAWEQYRWQMALIAAAFLGQTSVIVGLFYERRRRRRAEATARRRMGELAHLNRSAAAGELTASIAHEINQPLAAIVSSGDAGLRWLANKTPNLEEVAAALRRIVSDGHRAGDVIATVRAMFKRDIQERVPVDVNELIREVLDLLQVELDRSRVSVRTVLTDRLPRVLAVRIQLQQVMMNLIRNAVDAMMPVRDRVRLLLIVSEAGESGETIIKIGDNGQGIDPANLDRIFEPFFTTKSNGMGMGLSICRSIIEAHGGWLTAAPAKYSGSVFQIVLATPHRGLE